MQSPFHCILAVPLFKWSSEMALTALCAACRAHPHVASKGGLGSHSAAISTWRVDCVGSFQHTRPQAKLRIVRVHVNSVASVPLLPPPTWAQTREPLNTSATVTRKASLPIAPAKYAVLAEQGKQLIQGLGSEWRHLFKCYSCSPLTS
jgi:hypothetical protein